ncbi:Hsp20/alpha crystallin family protein [Cereibacter sphaeroides]|uniref:Hsp20/alpha crystallin family protein n=1 Tax=Cereibacter sphaeroides TaxID=1063 RepID=UPI000191C9F2|nr:Hsp20/alpha crystallin family protein [Cereibacter sphaeroides]ACM03609.1 Heat shock protein HSP20 [Cereibacter sphaeroides KD131]
MSDEKKPDPGRTTADIELRFGSLLSALGSALSDMTGRLESGQSREIRRDHTIDVGMGPIRTETRIRVRYASNIGSAGLEPGPMREAPEKPPVPARPIQADIATVGRTWQLQADLPGVAEEDLTLELDAGDLLISAEGSGRRYEGRFPLPAGVVLADIRISLKSGILDLTAPLPEAP